VGVRSRLTSLAVHLKSTDKKQHADFLTALPDIEFIRFGQKPTGEKRLWNTTARSCQLQVLSASSAKISRLFLFSAMMNCVHSMIGL
jgi:hypothetical protein